MDNYERPEHPGFPVQILATTSQPGGLSLDQISAIITSATPYPLQSIVEDHDGVIAVIGTLTPDGQPALSSMYWSRLELAQSNSPDLIVAMLVCSAADGLTRYVESFQPVPKWDQMQWGP